MECVLEAPGRGCSGPAVRGRSTTTFVDFPDCEAAHMCCGGFQSKHSERPVKIGRSAGVVRIFLTRQDDI